MRKSSKVKRVIVMGLVLLLFMTSTVTAPPTRASEANKEYLAETWPVSPVGNLYNISFRRYPANGTFFMDGDPYSKGFTYSTGNASGGALSVTIDVAGAGFIRLSGMFGRVRGTGNSILTIRRDNTLADRYFCNSGDSAQPVDIDIYPDTKQIVLHFQNDAGTVLHSFEVGFGDAFLERGVQQQPTHIPVTSITGVPSSATAGTPLALTGTVNPSNATDRTIVWSIPNSGSGASISGNTLNTNSGAVAPAFITIRATIANGRGPGIPYIEDFYFIVNPSHSPPTGITDVPTSATAGTPLTLTGTVQPANATNKTIVWSIANAGTTGATISGSTLNTTAAGTVTVRAAITHGLGTYTQDFRITVNAGFIPPTGIADVPTSATAGTPLTLTGTVQPANATNKTIVWNIVNLGTTGATISGSTLNTTAAGTVTVRATIANGLGAGLPYTEDFPIIVNTSHIPPTSITGVPTSATAGVALALTGTVYPVNATNKTIVWSVASAGSTGARISGSTLSTTAAGTVTVRATIVNGIAVDTPYIQDFAISVSSAPTAQHEIPNRGVSQWATEEVGRAYAENIVPPRLRDPSVDLREPVSRVEFAGIVVLTYQNLANTTLPVPSGNTFSDTSDVYARMAYNAGLMVGVSASRFDPITILNREQAATALTRVFKRWHIPGWTFESDREGLLNLNWSAPFTDNANISSWARENVYFMNTNGIIFGFPDGTFRPRTVAGNPAGYATATREQALIIALRMVEAMR